MYNVQGTMQCTVCSVQRKVCSVQCTVCSVQCTMYSVQCAMFSLRGVKYAICSGQCILAQKKVNPVWSIIDMCHNRLNRERLYRRTTFYQKKYM